MYFRYDEHDLPAFAGGFGEARQDKIKIFEQIGDPDRARRKGRQGRKEHRKK